MPIKYLPDGATEEAEAFTLDEVNERVQSAAAKAAEDARKSFEADTNGAAAAARREAESKQKLAEKAAKEATDKLNAALDDSTKSAEELKKLQAELQEAKGAAKIAAESVESVKADHARKLAIIELGAKPTAVAKVEALLTADGVDLADMEAVGAAIDAIKVDAPGLFAGTPDKQQYNPNTGAKTPPRREGAVTPDDVSKMSTDEVRKLIKR